MRAFIYTMTVAESLDELGVNAVSGLRKAQVNERQAKYGKNELKTGQKKPVRKRIIAQFKDIPSLLLIAAAVISAVFDEKIIQSIITISLLTGGIILYALVKSKNENYIYELGNMSVLKAKVLREGEFIEIDTRDVTVGDIVTVERGDIIPADIRITESTQLMVDEFSVTGDSSFVRKEADIILDGNASLNEQYNIAFMNSVVTAGKGTGVVYATGMNTQYGKMQTVPRTADDVKSPMLDLINSTGKSLNMLFIIICALILAVIILYDIFEIGHEYGIIASILLMITLAVITRPKNITASSLAVMTDSIQKLAKSGITVKNLHAIETIGSTDVICTGKTGVLTKNEMIITKVADPENIYDVTGVGYKPMGYVTAEIMITRNIALMSEIVVLCNNASYDRNTAQIKGQPTEGAMLVYGIKLGNDKKVLSEMRPRIHEIPFDSTRKMMSTYNINGDKVIMYSKGAAEEIINRSEYVYLDGEIVFMSDTVRAKLISQCGELAAEGLCVLACAYKVYNNQSEIDYDEYSLVYVGMMGMTDSLREGIPALVKKCRDAGIAIKIITGDHRNTVRAIARAYGITGRDDEILEASDLDEMTDEQLQEKVKTVNVFARITPAQKQRLVAAIKAAGYNTVTMTGEDLDDAHSLEAADVGITARKNGSDIAVKTADILTGNDVFVSVVNAAEQGRTVYLNIRKTISYILACNIALLLIIFIAAIFGLTLPLSVPQLLLISLLINLLPAAAIGTQEKEHGIFRTKPKKPEESVLNRRVVSSGISGAVIIFIGSFLAYFYGLYVAISTDGITQEMLAGSMCFLTMLTGSLLTSYPSKTGTFLIQRKTFFNNKRLNISILLSLTITFIIAFMPGAGSLFSVVPLSTAQTLICLLIVLLMMMGFEMSKFYTRR